MAQAEGNFRQHCQHKHAGVYRSEVEFEDLFLDILQSGEDRKTINRLVSELEPVIAEDQTSAVNENGNNVDIDGQSVEMARTVLAYQNSNKADCR